MDEFHHRGELEALLAAKSRRARCEQQQRRPQSLAAAGDDVLGDLAHQRHVRAEALPDQRIDALHVGGDRRQEGGGLHAGGARSLAQRL